MDKESVKVPAHVGIIMDGNGRWAELKGKNRSFGHRAGTANVERIVEHAFNVGVKALSLFAFSSENWARPKEEVDALMKLLERYLKKFADKVNKNGIKLTVMGDTTVLSERLKTIIAETEKATAGNSK